MSTLDTVPEDQRGALLSAALADALLPEIVEQPTLAERLVTFRDAVRVVIAELSDGAMLAVLSEGDPRRGLRLRNLGARIRRRALRLGQ